MSTQQTWYALRTKIRMEKSTGELLKGMGYETFVPVYISRRKWADRIKDLELPLFAGYIFCRFDVTKRLPILTTPGVLSIVGTRCGPVPVPREELAAVQAFLTCNKSAIEPAPCFTTGERVHVHSGTFAGMDGVLLNVKNAYRLVIAVTLIQRAVAVEINRDQVEPLGVSQCGSYSQMTAYETHSS